MLVVYALLVVVRVALEVLSGRRFKRRAVDFQLSRAATFTHVDDFHFRLVQSFDERTLVRVVILNVVVQLLPLSLASSDQFFRRFVSDCFSFHVFLRGAFPKLLFYRFYVVSFLLYSFFAGQLLALVVCAPSSTTVLFLLLSLLFVFYVLFEIAVAHAHVLRSQFRFDGSGNPFPIGA